MTSDRHFDLRRQTCLAEVLEEAAFRCRANTFLIETDRGRVLERVDFEAFQRRILRLAAALAADGVGPDTRVAILMANGPRWLIGAAAITRLGGVMVPLDARAEPTEQARLLAHCAAEVLLCDGPVWRRLTVDLRRVVVSEPLDTLGGARTTDWGAYVEGDRAAPPLAIRRREDLASIVYSSGTGGRPKGCMLTHGNYLSQVETLANLYPMEEDDVYLSILPSNHALDFMCGFLVPLLCGASVVHLRTLRPELVTGALKDHGVTHMSAVPALLDALVRGVRQKTVGLPPVAEAGLRGMKALNRWLTRQGPNHAVSRTLLAPIHAAFGGRLRRIFAGGAFVPPSTARALWELGLPVAIGYGLTEACAVVSVNDLAPFRDDTVGPPVPGTELKIAERDERGQGEVWVRGPQVFAGYLDDADLSAEVLSEDGWLRTGDLGELDATGHLRLVGRIKNMIVTPGGKNVYPEDVEGCFHGVEAEEFAVVAARAIWPGKLGEGEALVLAVRPRQDDPEPLLRDVARRNRRLPAYQRVAGTLLVDEPFPRTTSLKLKRRELVGALAGHGPDELRPC